MSPARKKRRREGERRSPERSLAERREAEQRRAARRERRERRKAEARGERAQREAERPAHLPPAESRLSTPGALDSGARMTMVRGHPVVSLVEDGSEIGYCMRPTGTDDCFRAALATATQIPVEQVPDLRLDRRLRKGEDVERINRESWERMAEWLDGRGLELVFHRDVPVDRERWVGVCRGPTEATAAVATAAGFRLGDNPFNNHCLVMSYGDIVFDPAIGLELSDWLPRGARLRSWHPSQVVYGVSFDPKEE